MALRYFPRATILCFEIVARTAEQLNARFAEDKRVRVVPCGLSDEDGVRSVTCFAGSDSVSAIDPLPWEPQCSTVLCPVTTGSRFLEALGIEHVNILKVDTEGHDIMVLRGFVPFLQRSPIPVIQFEYGRMVIPRRVLLADFYDLLVPLGYHLGRIFPYGVRFKAYDFFEDEHFRNGNYAAVHETEPQILRALSVR